MTEPLTRILLVEDDPDIRTVAHLSLSVVGGFTVEMAASGSEALAGVQAFRPDLILLDVMMPGMDGPATLAALREAQIEVPVVFMTAKVQPQEVTQYKALGALDVVAKPFDPMTLPDTLRTLWSRSRD